MNLLKIQVPNDLYSYSVYDSELNAFRTGGTFYLSASWRDFRTVFTVVWGLKEIGGAGVAIYKKADSGYFHEVELDKELNLIEFTLSNFSHPYYLPKVIEALKAIVANIEIEKMLTSNE